ncbi:MAG: ribose-5-phosphate isomerase RpiA [Rhizobiales bacterium TMED94]|nr:ribose 5-phosphate isomerase A [Rhodobiaceae bacterium]RPF89567.1 MAG: ribose-5-phosphate isomerase RpiA [Rhizobiales bacterium TMED94]|tara:strand:+ start:227 stop:916 length:690 start_codon:yes stop_codon:yes gene_type:complete
MSKEMKIIAAKEAITYVKDGMTLGLGTGSTVDEFLILLSKEIQNGLNICGVVTSEKTKNLSNKLSIPLTTLENVKKLDLTIDGADEIDADLSLIKGGGGALLREKIIAFNSSEVLIIADESKLVDKLGIFKLPIEVSPYEHEVTSFKIMDKLNEVGYNGSISLRKDDQNIFITDGGNYIYDLSIGLINEPDNLEQLLNLIPGVFENGLFINLTKKVIIGSENGVRVITK